MTKPVLFRVTNNLNIGGVQRRLRSLLPRLLPYYDVHVVTYKDKGIFFDELASLGVKTHFIPLKGKWDPVGIYKMSRLFKKHNAQIVHTHSLGGNISGILAAAMARVPVRIAQVHTMLHWYGKTKLRRQKQIIEEAIVHKLFTHKVVFVSKNTRNYFQKKTQIAPKKLVILHNGIDLDALLDTPSSDSKIINLKKDKKKIIGFVGRLIAGKGISVLLEFAQNLSDNDNYLFLVVGSGPKQNYIKKFIHDNQLSNILLAGEISNIGTVYHSLDCLFFASRDNFEGMPGVVLEACAFGLPILARKSKPIEEIGQYYKRIHFIDKTVEPEKTLQATLDMPACDLTHFKKEFSIGSMVNKTLNLYTSLAQ